MERSTEKRETPEMKFYAEYYCEEHDEFETVGPFPSFEAANDSYDRVLTSCSPDDFNIYEGTE